MSDIETINIADHSRPLTFSDVVGQEFATGVGRRIGSGIISGQGYILTGPKGCGKTSVARIIARSVNCQHRDPETGDPCNKCPSCQLALKGAHPQIEEINAADKRGVGDMRQLLESMSLAVNNGYRVYILDEVHMLTKEAFSVLLKPMEQPPENVLFIATTTNPEMIPDTIVSRVPIIPINPLEEEDIRLVLQRVIEKNREEQPLWDEVTDSDITHAVRMAQGSARQAITTLSGVIYHGISQGEDVLAAQAISQNMLEGNTTEVLSSVMDILKEKTVNPVALTQLLMEELLRNVSTTPSTHRVAKMVADLSQVAVSLSSSTPAMMAAARIAACVLPAPASNPEILGDDSPPQQKPKRAPEREKKSAKKVDPVLQVTAKTTVGDVIYALLESERGIKTLPQYWLDVLDDEYRSDIDVQDGTAIITVKNPSQRFVQLVEALVSPVVVRSE